MLVNCSCTPSLDYLISSPNYTLIRCPKLESRQSTLLIVIKYIMIHIHLSHDTPGVLCEIQLNSALKMRYISINYKSIMDKLAPRGDLSFIDEVESKFEIDSAYRQSALMNPSIIQIRVTEPISEEPEDIEEQKQSIFHEKLVQVLNLEEQKYHTIDDPQGQGLHTQLRGSLIERAIDSYEFLTKYKMISNLGLNNEGVYHLVCFGFVFERSDKQTRELLTYHFMQLVITISEQNKWYLIYVHSDCTKGKGALKIMREEFVKMSNHHRKQLIHVFILQPNTWLKMRIFVKAQLCIQNEQKSLQLSKYNKLLDFIAHLKKTEPDSTVYQKFVKCLHSNIMKILQEEIKKSKKKDCPLSEADIQEILDISGSILTTNREHSEEPEFFKKFVRGSPPDSAEHSETCGSGSQYSQGRRDSSVSTHDVIGKPLRVFYRKKPETGAGEDIQVPLIFIRIYEYFLRDPSRIETPELFKKQTKQQLQLMDRLEQHFALGDYNFIFTIKEPQVVATYFKSVLKYMQEPLCTFQRYPKFKLICDHLIEVNDQTKRIIEGEAVLAVREIVSDMDQVHRDTWRFILIFFNTLSRNDKVIQRSIAQVFADILFKPTEIGANDMILWRLFTELLILMIEYNEQIFASIRPSQRSTTCGGNSKKSEDTASIQSTQKGMPLIEVVDFDDREILQHHMEQKALAKKKKEQMMMDG